MRPGQNYTFSVWANYEGSQAYQFNLTLSTAKDTIFANAGSSSLTGDKNSLILTATIIDAAYEVIDYSLFSCQWSCLTAIGKSSCKLGSTSQILNLTSYNSCSSVDISKKLSIGSYEIKVTVINKQTGSYCTGDSAFLTIGSGLIPVVVMAASDLKPGINDTSFELSAFIDPSTTTDDVSTFSYTWSTQPTCNGISYPTLDLTASGDGYPLATDPNGNFLKFNPGYLLPSTTYCFQVDIENVNSKGYSQMLVTTRDIPSG